MADANPTEETIADVLDRFLDAGNSVRDERAVEQVLAEHQGIADQLRECFETLRRLDESKLAFTVAADQSEGPASAQHFPAIPGFSIDGILGRGGMGVVYDAIQHPVNRAVALKVLPLASVDPIAIARFVREAEAAATLTHPSIVPVYAVGQHNGLHWYAMKKIDGVTLSQHLRQSNAALSSSDVLRIGIAAAEAIAAAHQAGIVHRDIKPGNLMIDRDEHVWLTDFGLARREVDVTATATGAMIGTPRYMSPEQVSGIEAAVDHRTDIYSLGATLYEVATGRPPFEDTSPLKLLTQIRGEDPPTAIQVCPSIPADLSRVLSQAMDKEPQHRYASMDAMASDLKAVQQSRPVAAAGVPWVIRGQRLFQRHRNTIRLAVASTIATVGVLMTVGLAAFAFHHARHGDIVIDSGGGPYATTITAVDSDGGFLEPIRVTTPTQESLTLIAGLHELRLSQTGQFDQRAMLNVSAMTERRVRFSDRRFDSPSIPTGDGLIRLVKGANGDAIGVVVLREDVLQTYGMNGALRETVDLTSIDSGPKGAILGYQREIGFEGHHDVVGSRFARPARLHVQSDLDQDGDHDIVLVASGSPPRIIAMTESGDILWDKTGSHWLDDGLTRGGQRTWPTVQRKRGNRSPGRLPSVMSLASIGDINDDRTDDLVAAISLRDAADQVEHGMVVIDGRTGDVLQEILVASVDESRAAHPNLQPDPQPPECLLLRRSLEYDRRPARLSGRGLKSVVTQRQLITETRLTLPGTRGAFTVIGRPNLWTDETRTLAAVVIGSDLYVCDLRSGELTCPAIPLAFTPDAAPTWIRSREGNPQLVTWGSRQAVPGPGNRMPARTAKPLQVTIHDVDGNTVRTASVGDTLPRPGWSASASDLPRLVSVGSVKSAFIFAERNSQDHDLVNIRCIDLSSMEDLWGKTPTIACAEPLPEHAVPIDDIDGDGTDEIAIVSLHTPENIRSRRQIHVYVDILSGADGQKLGFESQRIGQPVTSMGCAEIDWAESFDDGRGVKVSVRHGNDARESEMNSTVVVFRFGEQGTASVRIAPRLAVMAPDCDWYRQVADVNDEESELLIRAVADQGSTQWLQPHHVAAVWHESGRPQMLLQSDGATLHAMDALSTRRTWHSKQAMAAPQRVLARAWGERVLLIDGRTSSGPEDPAVVVIRDGATGKPMLQYEPLGNHAPLDAITHHDDESSVCVVLQKAGTGGGPTSSTIASAFSLAFIDLRNRTVLHQTDSLRGGSLNQYYNATLPMELVRHPQSGEIDLVMPDIDQQGMWMQCFNAVTGNPKWRRTMAMEPQSHTDHRLPLMCSAIVRNQPIAAYLDLSGDGNDWRVKVVHLVDSDRQYAGPPVPRTNTGTYIDTDRTQFAKLSDDSSDGRFVLICDGVYQSDEKGVMVQILEWTNDRMVEVSRSTYWSDEDLSDGPELERKDMQGVYLVDVDGDGIVERVAHGAGWATCHGVADGQRRWTKRFPVTSRLESRIDSIGDHHYMRCSDADDRVRWLDLRSGQFTLTSSQRVSRWSMGELQLPKLVDSPSGPMMIAQTRNAVVTELLATGGDNALESRLIPTSQDPRRYRPVMDTPSPEITRQFAAYGIVSFFAVLWPVGFAFQTLRRRRWSLGRLMIAVPIAAMTMLAWRWLPTIATPRVSIPAVLTVGSLLAGLLVTIVLAVWYASMRWRLGLLSLLILSTIVVMQISLWNVTNDSDYFVAVAGPWDWFWMAIWIAAVIGCAAVFRVRGFAYARRAA